MKKQKICIIGGSLSGLVTAIALSKLYCEIDLITDNQNQNFQSNRSLAISEDNLDFLNKLDISKSLKKEAWPCSVMKLYTENMNEKFSEIFELNNENKEKQILYMLENSKIANLMMEKIKKIKSISIINFKKISEIGTSGLLKTIKFNNHTSKYNLVIVCTGHNSDLVKKFFDEGKIENSYKEIAITTILNHSSLKNNTVRQIFLDEEILALLPISNTKTSIVWSIKNKKINMNDLFFKKKIKFYTKNYLKKVKFTTNIECKDLTLLIRNKYFVDRTLLFGDALHVVHPFIGQGFNMTLRDLTALKKILTQKIYLGLDVGSSDILSEFSNEIKPRNFIFSIGSDLLKKSLSFKEPRNNAFRMLNKNEFVKNIFFNIANTGPRF
tara:strand:- start:748 stop:1896 length:1149 start_codon:yes stop_codon:yes gene_type:complete